MDNKQIESIIKYNTKRQYFGKWTSAEIHSILSALKQGKTISTTVTTGKITMKNICETLWNEMSYNPVRFGIENPFITNETIDIEQCNLRYKPENNPNYSFMLSLKAELEHCINLLTTYDSSFRNTETTHSNIMYINMENEYSNTTNIEYRILSSLAKCIHLICSINYQDFKSSENHHKDITQIVTQRHPNLLRPLNRTIFVTIPDNIKNNSHKKIVELQKAEQKLNNAITAIQNNIRDIEMKIDSIMDYDFPGDSSTEKQKLTQEQKKLSQLEQALAYNQTQQQNLK